jgi:hypothetical protein
MEFLALLILLGMCFQSFIEEQIEKKTIKEKIKIKK